MTRKPYQKPVLKFGEVLARQTDIGVQYGVCVYNKYLKWWNKCTITASGSGSYK